jgi:hypothetical protein
MRLVMAQEIRQGVNSRVSSIRFLINQLSDNYTMLGTRASVNPIPANCGLDSCAGSAGASLQSVTPTGKFGGEGAEGVTGKVCATRELQAFFPDPQEFLIRNS